MKSRSLVLVLIVGLLTACGRPSGAQPTRPAVAPASRQQPPAALAASPSPPLAAVPSVQGFTPAAIATARPKAWSGPGGTVMQQLQRLLPAGATLEPVPGAGDSHYLTQALTAPGARDVLALYAAGEPYVGYGSQYTAEGRGPGARHRACHLLVATPTAQQGLKVLWWSPYAGLWTPPPQFLHFLPGGPPQLFVDLPEGASAGDHVSVVSFAGGVVRVLLADNGGGPQVLPPEQPGTLPGLAFHHHDTGGSGTWVVWRWSLELGRFVRADGAFRNFYRREAAHVPLEPKGAAWVDYYAALTHLQAREDGAALGLAEQGIGGVGYMHDSPAFYEIEGTVYRRRGNCARAVSLYQRVVAARQPGGGLDWPALPRAYYGLALCARSTGQVDQMRSYLGRAIAAGHGRPRQPGTPPDDWYGFAQAKKLLAG